MCDLANCRFVQLTLRVMAVVPDQDVGVVPDQDVGVAVAAVEPPPWRDQG